ncbi:MAG: TetR/AcrR family transcriptional regulator C-terminal domain-containing protein [Ruminococcus sp.]|nr:TetR/AcrR family transcriptional regulator C-terminal domain-containing protein [Ruminococcus sp.]
MKRKTAKEILAESFRELAEKKNIDKITVKDIIENCGYSSATFYRHFKDKYDLIVWDQTRQVAAVMKQIGQNGYPWRQTLLDGARGFQKNKDYLNNLLRHTSGQDSFIRNMTEINYTALKEQVVRSDRIGELDEKTDMYIRLYCQGTVALTCDWILGRYNATPEELAEVYEKSLPEPLKEFLY